MSLELNDGVNITRAGGGFASGTKGSVVVITPSDVKTASGEVIEAASQIASLLNDVKTQMTGIGWDDENARIYKDKFDVLSKSFDNFKANCESYGIFLGDIANAYEDLAEKTKNAVSSEQDNS